MFELKEITDDFTTHSFIDDPMILSYVLSKLRDIYAGFSHIRTICMPANMRHYIMHTLYMMC